MGPPKKLRRVEDEEDLASAAPPRDDGGPTAKASTHRDCSFCRSRNRQQAAKRRDERKDFILAGCYLRRLRRELVIL